jgi:hypothetical protein
MPLQGTRIARQPLAPLVTSWTAGGPQIVSPGSTAALPAALSPVTADNPALIGVSGVRAGTSDAALSSPAHEHVKRVSELPDDAFGAAPRDHDHPHRWRDTAFFGRAVAHVAALEGHGHGHGLGYQLADGASALIFWVDGRDGRQPLIARLCGPSQHIAVVEELKSKVRGTIAPIDCHVQTGFVFGAGHIYADPDTLQPAGAQAASSTPRGRQLYVELQPYIGEVIRWSARTFSAQLSHRAEP